MALVIADRVKETTTTTGTGTINLAGAASGFQSFVSGVGNSNTTFYTIEDANGAWEIGIGTITDASPDTLARTTVLATSNGDTTKITLSSGTHTVFGTYPAGKAVYLDASGNLSHTVDISSDTNLAGGTGITLTGDTLSTTDSEIVHDNLSGFVANEHIDWTTDQGSTNIHSGNYTDTNTMGSGFTVSATTDTNATTITEGDDLFFAAGDGTVTISCTVTDTDTTYTKASFDLDHLFTLVGAAADTSENLGTFTGSTIADNQTIKAAIQAVETAVETKGATAGSSSIVTVGTISSGTWQGTAIAQAYIANDAINGDKIADDAVDSEHYAAGSIDEEHLNATNTPTDNYVLSYDADSGGFTWVSGGGGGEANQNAFSTISVADEDDVAADSTTDTLTLAAGSNVTITTTAASDTVTIASTDTTYTKASFDLDHLFVLVGASADTDENLGTFTGSTISDSRTIKQALQDLETELETKTSNTGDITGVDLTGGTGISIDSETNTASGSYSSTITCNLEGTELASTGETGTSKFLRVDGDGTCSWQVPPDTDTTYTKASFDLDHLFVLVGASADTDENLGTFTGSTISDSRTIKQALQDLETELETKTSNTGDITGVDLTGGVGISIDSETNTGSGSYSSTITCNLEGTELASTGETGTSKFLRVDGDGTCSWQVPPDTNTTYAKADFDLDHLFTLVGASADSDEHLGTFTGSTISDNQTIKAAIQALETAVETKGAGDITGVDLTGGTGISIDSETNTGSGAYSSTITCNLEGTELASTGETGTAKFLRVDGDGTCSWQVPPDTDTTYTKASFDIDHLFTLVGASADTDENLGTFTGSTISDSRTIKQALQDLETELETKGAGDMTGVDLTGGTGISIDSETNTGSGAYSSTITCNLEGTELASTGETGTAKFLRVDGDGTCSWQVPPDTNTTYAKADFDIDHLFTLVGASADTDENLGTFTGSTISDSRTIKQALQDLETELETKTTNTGDITGVDLTGGTGISIDSETNTGSGAYSSTITCNLEGTELASTGETGTAKFLRVDGDGTCSWQVPPDTNTTYSGGTNLTLAGTTFNVDDAFLKNDADDTTSGTVTMANLIVGDAGNIGSASDTDAIAIASDGEVTLSQRTTFSKAVKTPLKSNTDASTITFDLDEASTHTVTLGDNRTLAISNEDAGQKFIINLVQDGTGSRTVTWFSTIKWAGGSAPTLTTTANKADSFGFLCTGTDAYYGFVIGQNI